VTDARDQKALEQIGQVDLDKVAAAAEVRQDGINETLDALTTLSDDDKLTDWEYDFVESVNHQVIQGRILSDKQYEILLQMQVKYE